MAGLKVSNRSPNRVGSLGAMVKVMRSLDTVPAAGAVVDPVASKRKLVAGLCKLLGEQMGGKPVSRQVESTANGAPANGAGLEAGLPPRVQQTLRRLLAGDAEKEIARHLGVSKHTVHVYVKALYRRFDVNSRGELLSRFVNATYQTPAGPSGPAE
ncbi:MAG: Transcriptional regulator, LuxR family protein [Phycisphaerales bacterium]|nr:Transcriptional regulator, LuxR family protein [Phycisphaerales bacterium]